MRWLGPAAVAGVLAASPAFAWEGTPDYTIEETTGLYETRPSYATSLGNTTDASIPIDLPFAFPYWGVHSDRMWVAAQGFVQIGVETGYPQSTPGYLRTLQPGGQSDGLCGPRWARIEHASMWWWTDGAAPDRRVVVSWEDCRSTAESAERIFFQAKFHETSGRIEFAYRPDTTPSEWGEEWYSVGMAAPGADPRWIVPRVDDPRQQEGRPPADFVFTPRRVRFTGRVLHDRIFPGTSGIPSVPVADVPVAGATVELRLTYVSANGEVAGTAVTDGDGAFEFTTFAGHTALLPEVYVVAKSAFGEVRSPSGTAALSFRVAHSLDFAGDTDLGTRRITAAADPSAAFRAPLAVATALGPAYERIAELSPEQIPPVTVRWSPTDTDATSYDASTRTLRIAGPQAANPDSWDGPVAVRTWGRHVLASVAAAHAGTPDDRFDAVTTEGNAFAVAFGHYVAALASGGDGFVDGLSADSAISLRLESVEPTSAGPACAASVAGALWDLLDAAGEPEDEIDGTGWPGRVLTVAAGMGTAPTAASFLDAWVAAGHDAAAITRLWIGSGILGDDDLEPNDRATEAAPLGAAGVLRRGLVLNRHQEDWFSVTLAAPAPALVCEVKDEGSAAGVGVAVEIRSAAGTLLATGSQRPATGSVRAQATAVAAGTYRCVVRHVSGDALASYAIQAFVPVELGTDPIRDWTVGRPYDHPVEVHHGIPPYTLGTAPGASPPPGIVLRSDGLRGVGTPLAAGEYAVTVQASDSGYPVSTATRSVAVRIHDVLRIALPGVVCFPEGRAVDTTLPTTGGTPPLVFEIASGSLPDGLGLEEGTIRVTGVAAGPGSTDLELAGTDVAGSTDLAVLRAVAAVEGRGKAAPAPLAGGPASCGWWFDAVEGSAVSVVVTTQKKLPKRRISGVLIGPDRSVVPGGLVRTRQGGVQATKFTCPSSGRYYFVATADDGGAATTLLGTISAVPARKLKSALPGFGPDDVAEVRIGALPGSTVVLRFSGEKRSALAVRLLEVRDPSGALVPHAGAVRESTLGGRLTLTLATGGTWTFLLGGHSGTGMDGKLGWSAVVRTPKGAGWSSD